jgi:hypothetical protein
MREREDRELRVAKTTGGRGKAQSSMTLPTIKMVQYRKKNKK